MCTLSPEVAKALRTSRRLCRLRTASLGRVASSAHCFCGKDRAADPKLLICAKGHRGLRSKSSLRSVAGLHRALCACREVGVDLFSPLKPPVTDAKSVCIDRSSPPNRFTMKPAIGKNKCTQLASRPHKKGSLQFATACPGLRILPRSRPPEARNWLPAPGRRCTSKRM